MYIRLLLFDMFMLVDLCYLVFPFYRTYYIYEIRTGLVKEIIFILTRVLNSQH
uniref:Uncharacterized protein n=1 Tax=Arundo donax TaxID=35708 RepID=A0A0A9H4U2_ARUDO